MFTKLYYAICHLKCLEKMTKFSANYIGNMIVCHNGSQQNSVKLLFVFFKFSKLFKSVDFLNATTKTKCAFTNYFYDIYIL